MKDIKESEMSKNVTFVKGTDTTNYSQSTALFEKLQREAKKEAEAFKTNSPSQKTKVSRAANSLRL